MKTSLLTFFLSLLVSFLSYAQKPEKVKGNRNLILQQTDISSFHTIIIDEDFEVEIIYNRNPSVEIETDENLHEFIEFQVIDSVLTFNKTARIRSKKKLNIKVNYDDALQHIETLDDGEITSLTSMGLTNGSLKTQGSSKVNLTLKAEAFSFKSVDKSKVNLNVTADNIKIEMSGTSKLNAFINAPKLTADLYQRATANIEGTSQDALLRLDNYTQFNGKNFTVATCNVTCEIASDVYIEVTEAITIEASGTCGIYVYNNPKITINRFTDTVKLQKKTK